jgi:hypothetical protein
MPMGFWREGDRDDLNRLTAEFLRSCHDNFLPHRARLKLYLEAGNRRPCTIDKHTAAQCLSYRAQQLCFPQVGNVMNVEKGNLSCLLP